MRVHAAMVGGDGSNGSSITGVIEKMVGVMDMVGSFSPGGWNQESHQKNMQNIQEKKIC